MVIRDHVNLYGILVNIDFISMVIVLGHVILSEIQSFRFYFRSW